jgi:tetratricopeptide (TPR) repeat protein
MRRSVMTVAALALMMALYVPFTPAQTEQQPAAAQDQKQAEADAYKAWYDANAAKDVNKAFALAKEYLAKFPNGQYAAYLRDKWLPQTRGYLFGKAIEAKDMNQMLAIGREALEKDPENLDYIYLMAVNLRANELAASPPNYAHAAEIADFTQRAIRLIESGKVPAIVDKAKWNQNVQLAYLYQGLAVIEEHRKNTDKALEHYMKAASLESSNPAYYFACGRLHQEKYLSAVQKYQGFPEADRTADPPKEEVKAALDLANKHADMVIDCWARYVALTPNKTATRDQVEKVITDLYKYRHPDSPDGLQKLIEQYRSATPGSTSNTSSSASTKP